VVALAASFDSDGLYLRLLGLLYRATLQRSPSDRPAGPAKSLLGRRLAEAGFQVEERWQPVGRNRVHLVIAECSTD
jgi:hypothetical protein